MCTFWSTLSFVKVGGQHLALFEHRSKAHLSDCFSFVTRLAYPAIVCMDAQLSSCWLIE